MSERLDLAVIKDEHYLPFFVSGRCQSCYPILIQMQRKGLIPKDKDLQTVFFDRSGRFGYRCINSRCLNKRQDALGYKTYETLKCFLRHRDFDLASMDVRFEDEVWVDRNGQVDLDDPHMDRYISLTYGPLKDCPGVLEWDNTRELDGAEWLRCDSCNAKYKAYVFGYSSSVSNELHRDHALYELIPNTTSAWAVRRRSGSRSNWTYDVPLDWAMAVVEVRHPRLSQTLLIKPRGEA